jgi:hypothetical protein
MLSGESELLRKTKERIKAKAKKQAKAMGEATEDDAKALAEERDDEVKRQVGKPRRDLLKHLVEVERKQRSMLTNIEGLSRQVRAATFNKINKEMEDLVESSVN